MKMYVVSGCPRSGTSLMMHCLTVALGKDRLVGSKFPAEEVRRHALRQRPDETDEQHALRLYIDSLTKDKTDKEIAKMKDLNPNGFFEDGRFCVKGLTYNLSTARLVHKIRTSTDPAPFGKIVSQGLPATDPTLVGRVIFMIRDPFSVAKSQERLKRKGEVRLKDQEVDLFGDEPQHVPDMFIQVTLDAARWRLQNPDVPVLDVSYDDLVDMPVETLALVQEFLGEGDFPEAAKLINPRLRRSEPESENYPQEAWEDAGLVHKMFVAGEYKEMLKIFQDPKRKINRKHNQWLCLRCQAPMVENHCKTCKISKEFRDSLVKHAEEKKVPWKERPCVYECCFDNDNPLISIEESIKNHFWLEEEDAS